jgi:hypothetical protein
MANSPPSLRLLTEMHADQKRKRLADHHCAGQ